MKFKFFGQAVVLAAAAVIFILTGQFDPVVTGICLFGTLVVPDVGEVSLLTKALTAEDLTLELFVSNTTPAEGDTFATYTIANGGGYAAKTLDTGDWTVATNSGTTSAVQPEQTFTFTGALTTNTTIYGYLVKNATDVLQWAERAAATFVPANNGDTYKVTPRIEAA